MDDYSDLKPSLRRAIDNTFFKLLKQTTESNSRPAKNRSPVNTSNDEDAGGFVVNDDGEDQASDNEKKECIPLSLVPTGLQMLDLPPNDQEVLAVFRNAATGWENPRPRVVRSGADDDEKGEPDRDEGLSVSKEDWRAVCAVLLGQTQEEVKPEGSKAGRARSTKRPSVQPMPTDERRQTGASTRKMNEVESERPESDFEEGGFVVDKDEEGGFDPVSEDGGESDSDKYSGSALSDESSASEFGDVSTRSRTTRVTEHDHEDEDDSDVAEDMDMPLAMTARQEREARLAFALFFPAMDPNDPALNTKKIGIREVADASRALKEKISTDDIIEMLGMFSSGSSGTIGLDEFGRMAVMAKLV